MKLKIIHTLSNSGTGGGQTHVLDLLRFTDRNKFDVQIICNSKGHYLRDFHRYADKVHEVNFDRFPLLVLIEIIKIIRAEKPDILHNHLLRSCFLGSIGGLLNRVKSINNLHGDIQDDQNQSKGKKMIYHWLNALLSGMGALFICVSKFNKHRLEASGVSADNITVIYNGVNTFDLTDRSIKKAPVNVLCIARLHPAKGIDTILKAAPFLSPQIVIHIVGDGPLEKEYRKYIHEQKISNVNLHGFQTNVHPFLEAADMFILTSNWEGLPIAIVEAMAARLPVIATNVGGISEIVHPQKGGFLFEPKDYKTLATLINTMSQNDSLRAQYGQYNYAFYQQHLTLNKMIEFTENLYLASA